MAITKISNCVWRRRLLNAVVGCCFTLGSGARAEPVALGGIDNVLWPLVVVTAPFGILQRLIFGSDRDSIAKADARAREQLKKIDKPFETNGLYVGPIHIRDAFYGLLIDAKLPFVELDVTGSKWLFEEMEDPRPLLAEITERQPYIRIELAPSGTPGCVDLRKYGRFWHRVHGHEIQPASCLSFSFISELSSDLKLSVDFKRAPNRELSWVLQRMTTNEILVSVPFWQRQVEGQPLQASASYSVAGDSSVFANLIRKLHPASSVKGVNGRPLVLSRGRNLSFGMDLPAYRTSGTIEPIDPQPYVNPAPGSDWASVYERGLATSLPQKVPNSRFIFLPRDHELRDLISNQLSHLSESQSLLLQVGTKWGSVNSIEVYGIDIARDAKWRMTVDLLRSPELATRCSLPEDFNFGPNDLYFEVAESDEKGISVTGRYDRNRAWRDRCSVRINIPWPQPATE